MKFNPEAQFAQTPTPFRRQSFDNLVTESRIPMRLGRVKHCRTSESNFRDCCLLWWKEAVTTTDAEHSGANLLPCNAATRLQARAQSVHPCPHWPNSTEGWNKSFATSRCAF